MTRLQEVLQRAHVFMEFFAKRDFTKVNKQIGDWPSDQFVRGELVVVTKKGTKVGDKVTLKQSGVFTRARQDPEFTIKNVQGDRVTVTLDSDPKKMLVLKVPKL